MEEVFIERKISMVSNIKSIIALYKLIRKEKYDIVHVHTPVAAILGRIAAKLAGVKHIIYTAHGFYFHENMSKPVYFMLYAIEKWFARLFTNYLLLQSKEDYDLACEARFQAPYRIIHLSNGVDVFGRFDPTRIDHSTALEIRQTYQIKNNDVVFSFIGRMVREKGIFELVQAFMKLAEEYPNVKLLLIGGLSVSERDQAAYHELLNSIQNHAQMIMTGQRSDIPELLSISDVFVLPSYREGLPRSIIEAMSLGKAVIATNIRGCREEVFPAMNGLLVNRKDSTDLYMKMKQMVTNPDDRLTMGQRGREIAIERFNEQTVLGKQLDLFSALTKGSIAK